MKRIFLLLVLVLSSLVSGWAGEVHEALINGHTEKALELLKADDKLVESRDKSDCTPLHYAAQQKLTEAVKWLIKHKADVNAVDNNERTPLDMTTDGPTAKLLIKAGADLKSSNATGRTALQRAALLKKKAVCDAILASGYPMDLSSALLLGKRDEAKKIIKKRPQAALDPGPGWDHWGNATPLGIAAGQGDVEMVDLLLKAGAPVNGVTAGPDGKMTPLCNAVWGGHLEVVGMLCNAGADCNMTGGHHIPHLLDFAVKHSDEKMVALLVRFGAKPGDEK